MLMYNTTMTNFASIDEYVSTVNYNILLPNEFSTSKAVP